MGCVGCGVAVLATHVTRYVCVFCGVKFVLFYYYGGVALFLETFIFEP